MAAAALDHRERPRRPRRVKGKGWAFILAVAVQLGFLAVLVFSVQWQRRPPEALSVELYAPPTKAPAPQPVQPPPTPAPEPPPPPPQPRPEPTPPPRPPEPVVEKPDTRAADIALKAKQEQEKRRKEEQERMAREEAVKQKLAEDKRKAEDKQKAEDKRKAEEKQKAEEKLKADEKLKAEARDREKRQQQELAAMRAQADREKDLRDQAAREQSQRQQQQQQQQAALSKGLAEWTSRIRSKIRGNVVVPPDIVGNPTAIFAVVQLPTGEILQATLVKSSGNRAYDEAVQRAILKSSPLPRPDRPELFQRELRLEFRPLD